MAFTLPAPNNLHNVLPTSNSRYVAGINSPTNLTNKAAGNLPITQSAGSFQNNNNGISKGIGYDFLASSADIDTVGTERIVLWHSQFNAPNRINVDTLANAGVVFKLYNGASVAGVLSTSYKAFYLGGQDTPYAECIKGQVNFVVDLKADNYDAEFPLLSGVSQNTHAYSIEYKKANMSSTVSHWNFNAKLYVISSKNNSESPRFSGSSTFTQAVEYIQGNDYTSKLGNWIRSIGDVIFIDMPFIIGSLSSGSTRFDDEGKTIVSPFNNQSNDPRIRARENNTFNWQINLTSSIDTADISGTYIWQTQSFAIFDAVPGATITHANSKFSGLNLDIRDGNTGYIFCDKCYSVTGNDLSFVNLNGTFSNPLGLELLITSEDMTIVDSNFLNYTGKIALFIEDAGTLTLENVFFDKSGTTDIQVNTAIGTVTTIIIDGGTIPRINNTGAGTFVLINNKTINVTVVDSNNTNIPNARVYITAAETKGTITIGDQILQDVTTSISPIVTKTDFNYEEAFGAGLSVNIRIRKSSQAPFYKTSESTGTITSEGLNLTVKMILDQ